MRMIPNDFWNQKFFTPFRFWGIPETPKNFFSKNIFFKRVPRAQFSIFFDGTGLKWKVFQFRTYVQSRFRRFLLLEVRKLWKSDPTVKILVFSKFSDLRREKSSDLALSLCAKLKYLSIKTGFVKIGWELRPALSAEKNYFRKKIFRGFGDSPEMKGGKKFLISEINRNHSHGHFKPSLGYFGWEMKVWRNA